MIDSIVNLIFRCSHKRLSRPVAPVSKAGQPHSASYVVCLDCGKRFAYDVREMKIGKVIEGSEERKLLVPEDTPRKRKLTYAMMAAMLTGAFVKRRKT